MLCQATCLSVVQTNFDKNIRARIRDPAAKILPECLNIPTLSVPRILTVWRPGLPFPMKEKTSARQARPRRGSGVSADKMSQQEAREIETLVERSGYEARELVKRIIDVFRLRGGSANRRGDRQGRTRITKDIRDMVKRELAAGKTLDQVARDTGVNYTLVGKISKGVYDEPGKAA